MSNMWGNKIIPFCPKCNSKREIGIVFKGYEKGKRYFICENEKCSKWELAEDWIKGEIPIKKTAKNMKPRKKRAKKKGELKMINYWHNYLELSELLFQFCENKLDENEKELYRKRIIELHDMQSKSQYGYKHYTFDEKCKFMLADLLKNGKADIEKWNSWISNSDKAKPTKSALEFAEKEGAEIILMKKDRSLLLHFDKPKNGSFLNRICIFEDYEYDPVEIAHYDRDCEIIEALKKKKKAENGVVQ